MQQQNNNQTMIVLAFIAGILVGTNWPKIKKAIGPLMAGMSEKAADVYATVAKFMSEQKENVEDKMAETKSRKKTQAKKTTSTRKKTTAKS